METEKTIIEGFLIRNGIIQPLAADAAAAKCLQDCMKIVQRLLTKEKPVKKKSDNFTKKLSSKRKSPASMLRALREREGLSQLAMANKIKTAQSYISAMELGKFAISENMAKRIAKKFKVDIGLFYKEKK